MTTGGEKRPRLRPVEVHPVVHDGRPSLYLRDPLQLAGDQVVIVPRELSGVLALLDGVRDVAGLQAMLRVQAGVRLEDGLLERLVDVLDEALLLDNARYAAACAQALDAFRTAPFRPPALADGVYPADKDALRAVLDGYLAGAGADPTSAEVRGIVSPHIDYDRGGPVYARVWRQAAPAARAADLVVILGTDHNGDDGALTLTRQDYATPYGVLPTAVDVVDAVADEIGEEAAFAGELRHRTEHSVELAAVWLHHVRGGDPCPVVPVLCGSFAYYVAVGAEPTADPALATAIAALRKATAGRRVLVVASADLAHVGPAFDGPPVDRAGADRLSSADRAVLDRIRSGDSVGFFAEIAAAGDRDNVCGLPPIYVALQLLGRTTGDVAGYDQCPADEDGTSLVSICGVVLH